MITKKAPKGCGVGTGTLCTQPVPRPPSTCPLLFPSTVTFFAFCTWTCSGGETLFSLCFHDLDVVSSISLVFIVRDFGLGFASVSFLLPLMLPQLGAFICWVSFFFFLKILAFLPFSFLYIIFSPSPTIPLAFPKPGGLSSTQSFLLHIYFLLFEEIWSLAIYLYKIALILMNYPHFFFSLSLIR